MIIKDYHGFTLKQALTDLEDTIAAVRTEELHRGIGVDAEFIVGHGVIRDKLIELLKARGLTPEVMLGNDGVIVCVIE